MTASHALLEQLAGEQRRVLSGWRGLILLRRSTYAIPPHERRWEHLPQDISDLTPLFRQMQRRGEIRPIGKFPRLYEVTVPYARQGFVDEREILFELNPYAALSHLSAFAFHGLTNDLPKGLVASVSADTYGALQPIGTRLGDWDGIPQPSARKPDQILGSPVRWHRVQPERFFGVAEYQPLGYPLRYTTIERTLIDGLQDPDLSGGIANVLRAWVIARDRINMNALVHDAERFDVAILRQRIGYVLDQLGLSHRIVDQWRARSKRGGSSRLVASEPFAPNFDERWNLSLNAPVHLLHESTT